MRNELGLLMKSFFIVSSILWFGCISATAHAQSFVINLTQEPKKDQPSGKGPFVVITLWNTSYNEDHLIEYKYAPRDYEILVTDSNGTLIDKTDFGKFAALEENPGYIGPSFIQMLNRHSAKLPPGQSLRDTFDLSEIYDLKPGAYRMRVVRRLTERPVDRYTQSNILEFSVF